VFRATGLKLRNTPEEMDTYLQQIITSMRPQTDTGRIQKVKEDGLLQAVCYITGDASSDEHKDGLERTDANHELRRQLLRDFVGSILEKNTQSLPKFLAMTRQLLVNTSVDFKAEKAPVGANEIFTAASAIAKDSTQLANLGRMVGTDYFVVEPKHMRPPQKASPAFVAADSDTLGLTPGDRQKVYKIIAYNRLPREFFDRTERGDAVLKVDAYQQQIRDVERNGSSTGKQKKIELERLVSELQAKHELVETLLKVGPEDIRAASLPELRKRLVCGVLFVDSYKLDRSDYCYRLFVHINGDEEAQAMQTKLLAFLKAQVTQNASYARMVFFGKDEWRSVLKPTTFTISSTTIKVEEKKSIRAPYMHAENTLFVHRWPEFEFIPAPYGLATPMFWYDPSSV
jgi:hypothetical protein